MRRTWLGPCANDGVLQLATVKYERWRRQPKRSLQRASFAQKPEPVEDDELRAFGLFVEVIASRGHPSSEAESDDLCAGVSLMPDCYLAKGLWYCPCDVKITVMGKGGASFSKTVRWIFTRDNCDILFAVLPLAKVEDEFVSGSGPLHLAATLHFHISAARSGYRPLAPIGLHGLPLSAVMHAWGLLGPEVLQDAAAGGAWRDVSRSGLLDGAPASSEPPLVAPGLLPACEDVPSAFAQEVVPGLLLASEEVLCGQTHLVELHDVGVGSLVEVSVRHSSGPTPFGARLLQLRGCGDTVELVEGPQCQENAPHSAAALLRVIEEGMDAALAGADGAWHVAVLPRAARDAEACAALAAAVVARRFGASFEEARRYVRRRWDVAVDPAWAERLGLELRRPPGLGPHSAQPSPSSLREAAPSAAQCLERACRATATDGAAAAAAFAAWLQAASGRPSRPPAAQQAVLWRRSWEPCVGECVRVHDAGWGSVAEIFRALVEWAEDALAGPMLTLRFMAKLPEGELLQVPQCVDAAGERWHLVALACSDAEHTTAAAITDRTHCFAFLRGASDWVFDTDGRLYPLHRNTLPGSLPDHFLCTSDSRPVAAVYARGAGATLGLDLQEADALPKPPPSPPLFLGCDPVFRIVTERMLQRVEGGAFRGGEDVPATAVLGLSGSADLAELQERIQQEMRIAPSGQLVLLLKETVPDSNGQWLHPVDDRLSVWSATHDVATLLLLFNTSVGSAAPTASGKADAQPQRQPQQLPLLCFYFDPSALRLVTLGVLLASDDDAPFAHTGWLASRAKMWAGAAPSAWACSLLGACLAMTPARMDWSFREQGIGFGRALVFEPSMCGRRAALPHRAFDAAAGWCGMAAALAQLVRPPPPPSLMGCAMFDGDATARGARKGRRGAEDAPTLEAWTALQRAVQDAGGLPLELVSVTGGGAATTVVFSVAHSGGMAAARRWALSVCERFAEPRALFKGRLLRHGPRELHLTAATASGGARVLWHAAAPGAAAAVARQLPAPLLSALRRPVDDLDIVEVRAPPSGDAGLSALADEHASALLAEEPPPPEPASKRSKRRAGMRRAAPAEAPAASAGASDDDASDSDRRPAHGHRPSGLSLGSAPGDDDASSAAAAEGAPPGLRGAASLDTTASPSDGARSDHGAGPQRVDCAQFASTGICLEGVRCRSTHPSCAQLARPEPCPFGCELRGRCPLQRCCAFAHGDAERDCPPYIRARPSSREASASSTPAGQRSGGGAQGQAQGDEIASAVVKRMLASTLDTLTALIAEARALSLAEEIQGVERELVALFTRGAARDAQLAFRSRAASRSSSCGPAREAVVPRSGALSRASSCESFFDDPGGREAANAARLVLATWGETTQPSTPRSSILTPGGGGGPRAGQPEGRLWPEGEVVLDAPGAPIALPPSGAAPALPIVSWHEPIVDAGSPGPLLAPEEAAPAVEAPVRWLEERPSSGLIARPREEPDRPQQPQARQQPQRFERRPIGYGHGLHVAAPLPGVGFTWHTSPFCISRTPNIHTPASHCSPARSPTSFSGYCSPIPGLPSGVASPSQRRSQSGYSSPSADRAHVGSTFFVGTATAQSGLMSRLMSLREARGEEKEDDGEVSSTDAPEATEGEADLLECLLHHAERLPHRHGARDPACLRFDLSSESLPCARRGLVPYAKAPYLNAFVQALLPCAPLMQLFAQLSWHMLNKQRLAYASLVQIAFQFFGCGDAPHGYPPFDASTFAEPLLRRFERGKPAANLGGSAWQGPTETLPRFAHFVIGQLHDECKWPTISPIVGHYEDSPVMRIFGGLLRTGAQQNPDVADIEPFLVLHLDIASEPCGSVAAALQRHLEQAECASFLRLPPYLFIHLLRFRNIDGVPTRISRHCHIDSRLELEETTSCVLRAVRYELCSAVCHYGELPDSGTYKTLARHGTGAAAAAPWVGRLAPAPSCSFAAPAAPQQAAPWFMPGGGGPNEWCLFDDAAVRVKLNEELSAVVQCEGFHVSLMMYRREDTKTISIRPHTL